MEREDNLLTNLRNIAGSSRISHSHSKRAAAIMRKGKT